MNNLSTLYPLAGFTRRERLNRHPVAVYDSGLVQNLDYQGKLSKRQLEQIAANYPVYKQAADNAGIPWQMLAAVHYRESSLSTKTRHHGGPFQFDPPLHQGEENFTRGAYLSAELIQQKSHFRLNPTDNDDAVIKDAFWGYNGRAYGSADKSTYVMNQSDDAHHNMHVRGTVLNENGERIYIDNIDQQMGAFTFYQELQEAFQ